MAGLSYREIAYVLGLVDASHEAVRQWVLRLEGLVVRVGRKGRRAIAVDENVLKVGGVRLYVWAAAWTPIPGRSWLSKPVSREWIWMPWPSRGIALKACKGRPTILVDEGSWYPDALRRLKLRWRVKPLG